MIGKGFTHRLLLVLLVYILSCSKHILCCSAELTGGGGKRSSSAKNFRTTGLASSTNSQYSLHKEANQALQNFGYGALHVLESFDKVYIQRISMCIIGIVALELLAKTMPALYQLYCRGWRGLKLLSSWYIDVVAACLFLTNDLGRILFIPICVVEHVVHQIYGYFPTMQQYTDISGSNKRIQEILMKCIIAPIIEELLFRYFPLHVLSMIPGRLKRKVSDKDKVLQMQFWVQVFASILFGAAHLDDHFADAVKAEFLPTSTRALSWQSSRALFCMFHSIYTYVPLFNERGLAAAVGAHMAWNTMVVLVLPDGRQYFPLRLCWIAVLAVIRLAPDSHDMPRNHCRQEDESTVEANLAS